MMQLILAVTALMGLSTAAPYQKRWIRSHTARFDNEQGNPLAAASPINVYQDILFNGMSLYTSPSSISLGGIKPNSGSNAAAFGAIDRARDGAPAISATYSESQIEWFDLRSFFYGCTTGNVGGVLSAAKDCTITAKGYTDDQGSDMAASQDFVFSASGLQNQMKEAYLDHSFRGLKKVEFTVNNDSGTVGLIDTVEYTVYSWGEID